MKLEEISTTKGVIALGSITISKLTSNLGMACYFVNRHGEVEVTHPAEFMVDCLPEDRALRTLMNFLQYDDAQLAAYLRGREDRLARLAQAASPPQQENDHAKDL